MPTPILQSIRARLWAKNQNWLCAIVGETGSGKSYSALSLAKKIDKAFNIDRVVFTPEDFMALLNSGKLRRGHAIVFDEAGVGMPAREWHSIQNKLLGYVLQTFRRENLAIIFTLPNVNFLDIQARKLFHATIQTLAINYGKRYVVTKYFINQSNPVHDKEYRKFPRIRSSEGTLVRINRYLIPHPPPALTKAYEKRKALFADQLKIDAEAGIKRVKEKREKKNISGIKMTCHKCQYTWLYQGFGHRKRVSCPSCDAKVPLPSHSTTKKP